MVNKYGGMGAVSSDIVVRPEFEFKEYVIPPDQIVNRVSNYPRAGKKILPTGTTIIEWDTGEVILPDGTVERTTIPLEGELCRSLTIIFDYEIEVGLYRDSKETYYSSVFPVQHIQRRAYPFNKTVIKTSRPTKFYIAAATTYDGIPVIDTGIPTEIATISTDKDEHFTGAIGLGEIEYEDIPGLIANKVEIINVNIQAKQALLYTLWFWDSATHADTDLDEDTFRDFINLDVATSGKQIGGTGQWYLQSSNMCILYEDKDEPTSDGYYTLHLGLMVSSGSGKLEGEAGQVQLDITYTPKL